MGATLGDVICAVQLVSDTNLIQFLDELASFGQTYQKDEQRYYHPQVEEHLDEMFELIFSLKC